MLGYLTPLHAEGLNNPTLVSFDGGLSFKTKLGLKTQTPIKKTKLAPAHSHGATLGDL